MDRVSKAERELVRKMQRQTNADRIRSMTDEELADFLDKTDPVYWNRQTWLDWLKEEAT